MNNRWFQLSLGILAMVTIANLQYGWTQFVPPMHSENHWSKSGIQLAFTIFVLLETFLVPIEGVLVDRLGPRPIVVAGGLLVGLAWLVDARASNLTMLYLGAALGGIGAGAVYGAAVGSALKRFPDRRGLAAGLTAGGFGIGSALTVVPIAHMIAVSGYRHTFEVFGWWQGSIVIVAGLLLTTPPRTAAEAGSATIAQTSVSLTPAAVLRSPAFYLLYAMLIMVATGGLLMTAQLAVIATDYAIAGVPVSLAGITLAALPFALTLDRLLNGISRPAFGALSDRIGRENAMFIAFMLQAAALTTLLAVAHNPLAFVLLTGLLFFSSGEIYSLFPATSTDLFGRDHATTNYGLLYTGKGIASFIVPIGSVITAATGSWVAVFILVIACNIITALLALLVLKPLRRRIIGGAGRLSRRRGQRIAA
jgi:OFA family oxalate/formate antiporter-like MFS transporter